ncbi:MAG: hypothetical protein AB8G05_11690 [Oligoflexales bacterium]
MTLNSKLKIAILSTVLTLISCSSDNSEDNGTPRSGKLKLNFSNLPPLKNGYLYEGWAIFQGILLTGGKFSEPKSTGKFNVDSDGNIIDSDGNIIIDGEFITSEDYSESDFFVLSIEPSPDPDEGPAPTHILSGKVNNGMANLLVDHSSAFDNNFSSSSGTYIFQTPTDGEGEEINERSGVWFVNAVPPTVSGLDLPTLPAGWKYEAWLVVDDTPFTTGKFTETSTADESAPFSGSLNSGPSYPGEDFINNAPDGVSFPLNPQGGKLVISLEPDPDDSQEPFQLKPLISDVSSDAISNTIYSMANTASEHVNNVSGSVAFSPN